MVRCVVLGLSAVSGSVNQQVSVEPMILMKFNVDGCVRSPPVFLIKNEKKETRHIIEVGTNLWHESTRLPAQSPDIRHITGL